MIEAPVLHVNGDDPEAVVLATQLALEFRMEFQKDVVVDIICFRKLGHNEQDTPSLTQPLMYKKIAAHPGTRKLYADKLAAQGLGDTLGDDMVKALARRVRRGQEHVRPGADQLQEQVRGRLEPLPEQEVDRRRRHRHSHGRMEAPGRAHHHASRRASRVHPLVKKVLRRSRRHGPRRRPTSTGAWASTWPSPRWWRAATRSACPAKTAAAAPSRTAMPCCTTRTARSTTKAPISPLQNVADNQAPFVVIDSILSEEAVLAFEYGYASNDPNTLVIWEAQFGDFVNGAQVVIDQFIASGEVEVGPRQRHHADAAARLRRPGPRAQLGASGALHAAGGRHQHAGGAAHHGRQIFHVLRRQMVRNLRKPLVIMTPKSLLRNKDATSPLSEFTKGGFQTVIPDRPRSQGRQGQARDRLLGQGVLRPRARTAPRRASTTSRSFASSSSIRSRTRRSRTELKKYPNVADVVWCQDEPQNQGAWFFVQHYIHENMQEGQKLGYSGRAASASPAVGYSHLHQEQQKALVEGAFGKLKGFVLTK